MQTSEINKTLAEITPAMIAVYNIRTGEYLYVNKSVQQLLGYQPKDFLEGGLTFATSLVHPDDLEAIMQRNAEALQTSNEMDINESTNELIVNFEYRMKHKNGEWRWLHTDGSVFSRLPNGEVECVMNISIDITDRKNAEEKLLILTQTLEERVQEKIEEREKLSADIEVQSKKLKNLLSTVPGVVWEAWGEPDDKAQQINYVSEFVETMLGYTVEEWLGTPNFWATIVHPEDRETAVQVSKDHYLKGGSGVNRFRWLTKDGRVLHIEAHSVIITNEAGNPVGMRGVNLDVTERVLAEEARVESEERYKMLLESVQDYGIFMLDPGGYIISWNTGAERIYGYTEKEIIGQHNSTFFTAEDNLDNQHEKELQKVLEEGRLESEGVRRKKDGTTFFVHSLITALYEKDKSLKGFVKVVRDITERKEAEDTIRHQAMHDSLTGLPNRKSLEERLDLALSMAARENSKVGLMFIDLDRFKNINDTLGHMIGDVLLKEVASRFKSCIRQEDTVARLGGDEFIILVPHINVTNDLIIVAEKILRSISQPIKIGQHTFHITTSIGITLSPADGNSIHTLLKNADTALYRAKDSGRNRYQFYNQTMNVKASERFKLENDFRKALTNGEFELYYQPIINIKHGKPVGIEALLRWNHPALGLIYPNEFIPIAEESGMISELGKWVMYSACSQHKQWFKDSLHPLQIAVNVSARQFSEPNFVADITQVIKETEMDPRLFELEITESLAMENIDRTTDKLNQLKKIGLQITIDDFGTGYSSLLYLKRFPINSMKIDKSFVRHAITNSNDATIIRTIISMAHNLNLKVIAEGVETEQQLMFLSALRCDRAQGYLIGKPMPKAAFEAWLSGK